MKDAILWKRILNEGLEVAEEVADPLELAFGAETNARFAQKIVTSPIILANWVGQNAFVPPDDDKLLSLWEIGDFVAAPPFKSFWLEWKFRNDIDSDGGATLGHLVVCKYGDIDFSMSIHKCVASSLWSPKLISTTTFVVGRDGRFDPGSVWYPSLDWVPRHIHEAEAHLHSVQINAVLSILSILGCKNVSLEPRDNDPKQVRKAIKRHGGNADKYRYHVLVVKPPGARSDAKGVEIGIMPRHVCRGHFSEYGPEFGKGLLFGRYAGRFYIPPHLKGDKKNGEVAKDYAIGGTP